MGGRLFPDGKDAPAGWQHAQDAFHKLELLGKAAGEPTYSWQLRFPSRFEKLKGQGWELIYSENREMLTVYIGHDALSTAHNINRMLDAMRKRAGDRNTDLATERQIHQQTVRTNLSRDPLFQPHFAQQLLETWRHGTRSLRTKEDLDKFRKSHPNLMRFLNRQAGVLNITVLAYLTRHPHAEFWPHPPRTAAEYEKRRQEYDKRFKTKDIK